MGAKQNTILLSFCYTVKTHTITSKTCYAKFSEELDQHLTEVSVTSQGDCYGGMRALVNLYSNGDYMLNTKALLQEVRLI